LESWGEGGEGEQGRGKRRLGGEGKGRARGPITKPKAVPWRFEERGEGRIGEGGAVSGPREEGTREREEGRG
jgi:hypothetical protein